MAMSLRLSFDEITDIMKLQHRSEVAERTMAFYFEKPKDFQFEPGQFADLTLIDPPETDAEGNRRTFSIASAPMRKGLCLRLACAIQRLNAFSGPFPSDTYPRTL